MKARVLFTPRWEEDPILIMDIEFPLVWLAGCGRLAGPRVARPAWLLSAARDLFTLRFFSWLISFHFILVFTVAVCFVFALFLYCFDLVLFVSFSFFFFFRGL